MKTGRKLAALCALLCVFALAACGGDSYEKIMSEYGQVAEAYAKAAPKALIGDEAAAKELKRLTKEAEKLNKRLEKISAKMTEEQAKEAEKIADRFISAFGG